MRVLVTGATGNVGRHVVDMLLDADVDVRALTRRPSVARLPAMAEVCQGDLYRPSSLADALRGVDRMFLFPVDETAKEVVELARKAGVRRIVVLSAAAVTIGLHTNPVEQVVEASGLEWTHVRPGEFMTNKLELWGPGVRAESRSSYTARRRTPCGARRRLRASRRASRNRRTPRAERIESRRAEPRFALTV